jgi:hypothetical protein
MAIYFLDVDDEITSAAARIRDSSDQHIALVLTGGARVATSRINFRLLAGEAKRRSKHLSIVTADRTVQSVARSAGLPVFGTVAEYERGENARVLVAAGAAASASAGAEGILTADQSGALEELAGTVIPGGALGRSGGNGNGRNGGGKGREAGSASWSGSPGESADRGRGRGSGIAWRLTAVVGLLAVVALVLGIVFVYPSATIVLTIGEQQLGPVTFNVTIDPNASATDDKAGIVPGVTKAFPVSTSGTFKATGQSVVETAATGTVTFRSENTAFTVPVPAGTRVGTASGVAFVTTVSVTVPKANFSTGTAGSVDAPVTAVTKGTAGNVAAGTIVNLPSDLAGFLVSSRPVTNKSPTTGGTHTVNPVIQQADIDNAEASLAAELAASFAAAIADPAAVPTGSTLLSITAKLGYSAFDPDPQAYLNQAVESFDLNARATGTAIVADLAGVLRLADSRVAAAVASGFALVESTTKAELGQPSMQGAAVIVPVTARAMQARRLDEGELRAAIMGKSVTQARDYLAQFGQVEISVSPGWSSSIPTFDFRIDFRLVKVSAQPSPSASAGSSATAAAASPPVATPRRTAAPAGSSMAPASSTAGPSATAGSSGPAPSSAASPAASPSRPASTGS